MKRENIFLDTLNGKETSRPPVWFMRQAGRVLPSYMKLRAKYGFKELMETPQLAADVTLLPIEDLGVDAAILFSDILVIPEALGMELSFEGQGPTFAKALKDVSKPSEFLTPTPEKLHHIYGAIEKIVKQKPEGIPLIGFCGAPLTTLCYMYQGFSRNQNFPDFIPALYRDKEELKRVIDIIVEMSIHYAQSQVRYGIEAFQLFETHAGIIPTELYRELFLPAVKRIMDSVRTMGIKTIFLPKGIGSGIDMVNYDLCDALSVDWQTPLSTARKAVGNEMVLQGNFDPRILETDFKTIEREFEHYREFATNDTKYIFNLGHGLLPTIPVANVQHLVKLVKSIER